jgi:peroxiredoxin Q/BCP
MSNPTVTDFRAPATSNKDVQLSALRGWNVVLYFYPKDDTPGCTIEGRDFRDHYADFRAARTLVFGVSRDSLASHERFRAKHGFPFELISDADEALCTQFGVIRMKNMYGKQVRGIERSTFLIDAQGRLAREWRGVKVEGHAAEVLAAARAL